MLDPARLEYAKNLQQLVLAQEAKARWLRTNKIVRFYPDQGPLRRELYVKHMQCFKAGQKFKVRAALGANRVGKSEGIGCYETVLHMTGQYPSWWEGRRFDKPIVGITLAHEPKLLRRGVQRKLFGGRSFGEGLYPLSVLDRDGIRTINGGGGAYEFAPIKHVSGGWSEHLFGTYKQGREAFESIELDWFHEDEEAPEDIHDEIVMRTMTTNGCGILTYTPLKGLSPLTERIWTQKDSMTPDVHVTNITWDDVPHLTKEQKETILNGTPGYLRDARSKGIPASGVGRIYPLKEEAYKVKKFDIPPYWRRVFAIDCGWHMTAVVWLAWDKDNDVVYVTSEHYMPEQPPSVHATAIKARGVWIPGVGDAAGASQMTGEQFIDIYRELGVRIKLPDKSVDGGIAKVMERLSTGRLKIFDNCENQLREMLSYSYDEKQNVIKHNDHACDALRYGIVSGLDISRTNHALDAEPKVNEMTFGVYD